MVKHGDRRLSKCTRQVLTCWRFRPILASDAEVMNFGKVLWSLGLTTVKPENPLKIGNFAGKMDEESGRSSGAEHQLPELGVAGSNPVARSN